jgi:hypothetical protein
VKVPSIGRVPGFLDEAKFNAGLDVTEAKGARPGSGWREGGIIRGKSLRRK